MKRLLKIGLTLGIVISCIFSSVGVSAMAVVPKVVTPKNLQVTKTANNNYDLQVGANVLHFGNPNVTSSFTVMSEFPDWQGYAWNADLKLTMGVTGNALAMAGMTSSSTSTSVTASNSYFKITYAGVAVNPPFNETGGMDLNITLKQNVGNTLAFGYNSTNVNAYLQPSLTKEWTVGQDLGNGNTVASVTDTDVTDNLGNNVAHRPDYVVNSIAFYHNSQGGMVSDVQAATGLTTGQIGMLYRMKVTDSSPTPKTTWADWSIPNGTNLWLNLNTAGMTYPITISPAGDTFGYITAGASDTSIYNTVRAGIYTGVAGTGTSISAYIDTTVFESGTTLFKYSLYNGTNPYAQTTNGGVTEIVDSTHSPSWFTSNFISNPTLTAQSYYIAAWASRNGPGTYSYIYYTSTAGTGYNVSKTYVTGNSGWTANLAASNNTDKYSIYCTYTAGGGSTYNLTNSPSSIDFGVIQPNTKYYAYGSAPSNPVTDGQCTFTITNGQSNAIKVNIQATNFTGGGGWTLGAPDGTHARLIAYTSGSNPASGVTLTTSPQTFVASLAGSATIKWDFSFEDATVFADGVQKSSTITLTGVAP